MTQLKNLVFQISDSIGTGNFALSPVAGWRTFASAYGTENAARYTIRHTTKPEYEIGNGHIDITGDFLRDEIIESSNNNAIVDFSAGLKEVVCSADADWLYAASAVIGSPVNPTLGNKPVGSLSINFNTKEVFLKTKAPAYVPDCIFDFVLNEGNVSVSNKVSGAVLSTPNSFSAVAGAQHPSAVCFNRDNTQYAICDTPYPTKDVTVFATIKMGESGTIWLLSRGAPGESISTNVWELFLSADHAFLGIETGAGAGHNVTITYDPPINMQDGCWHDISLTVDADGLSTFKVDNVIRWQSTITLADTTATKTLIAARSNTTSGDWTASVYIDTLKIYNRVLTDSELDTLHSAEASWQSIGFICPTQTPMQIEEHESDPIQADMATNSCIASRASGGIFYKSATGMYTVTGVYTVDS